MLILYYLCLYSRSMFCEFLFFKRKIILREKYEVKEIYLFFLLKKQHFNKIYENKWIYFVKKFFREIEWPLSQNNKKNTRDFKWILLFFNKKSDQSPWQSFQTKLFINSLRVKCSCLFGHCLIRHLSLLICTTRAQQVPWEIVIGIQQVQKSGDENWKKLRINKIQKIKYKIIQKHKLSKKKIRR